MKLIAPGKKHAHSNEHADGDVFVKRGFAELVKLLFPVMGLITIVAFFYIMSRGRLLSLMNLRIIANQAFITLLASLGAICVVAQGNLDFSIGANIGMSMFAITAIAPSNPLLALVAGVAVGTLIGCINGCIHAILGVPSFLTTMCVMYICQGMLALTMSTSWGAVPDSMLWLDDIKTKCVFAVAVLLIFYFLYEKTKVGKQSRALGSNIIAAEQGGVNVRLMKIVSFAISGFMAGVCGYFTYVRSGAVSPQSGNMVQIDVMIALVLGGASLTGGIGVKFRSVLIGALTYATLSNGLILWGLDENLLQGVKGIIFLIAVAISYDRRSVTYIK